MLKFRESITLVYHWWSDYSDVKPYQDLRNPIIASIATLRAHNKDLPINVIDVSDQHKDWGDFPKILNFQVIKSKPKIDLRLHKSSKLCSRVWDVWEFAQQSKYDNFLFTDSDIFWLKDPFPLTQCHDGNIDKFYCNSNTGVWYFNKNSQITSEVFRLWKFIISRVLINDEDFWKELCEKVPSAIDGRPFQDEVAFGYLITQYPELYKSIDFDENYAIYRLLNDDPLLDHVKCLHGLASVLGSKRGLICLILKELKSSIKKIFTKEQIKTVFDGEYWEQEYSVHDIKNLAYEEIKNLIEFTGCTRADSLLNELQVSKRLYI